MKELPSKKQWQRFLEDKGLSQDLILEYLEYIGNLCEAGVPVIFEFDHLAKLLGVKNSFLGPMVNSSESFYRIFKIKKRSGGLREISAPYPSLLYCQKWIYTSILKRKSIHTCAHGFVSDRSIFTNAQVHVGCSALLKMDLQDFFPSIPMNWVVNYFRQLGYAGNVAYYLASLCCLDGALPQGAATSPYLSNLLVSGLDRRLQGLAQSYDLKYSRYADDLAFSGRYIPHKYIGTVEAVVRDFGLAVNPGKTRLCYGPGKKIVTGLSVSGDQLALAYSGQSGH